MRSTTSAPCSRITSAHNAFQSGMPCSSTFLPSKTIRCCGPRYAMVPSASSLSKYGAGSRSFPYLMHSCTHVHFTHGTPAATASIHLIVRCGFSLMQITLQSNGTPATGAISDARRAFCSRSGFAVDGQVTTNAAEIALKSTKNTTYAEKRKHTYAHCCSGDTTTLCHPETSLCRVSTPPTALSSRPRPLALET